MVEIVTNLAGLAIIGIVVASVVSGLVAFALGR